jgi:hypothetical protein
MLDREIPDTIVMRHLGTLEQPGVVIELDPPSKKGVRAFVPEALFGLENPNDFRWLIDLGGRDFHDCTVAIDGPGTEPNILINDGLFYTAVRTAETFRVLRTGGGKPGVEIEPVAAVIGVNVDLKDDNKLKVSWTDDGHERELILPVPDAPPGVKDYEIRINNDPAYVDPKSDLSEHDELKEYYQVVEKLISNGNNVEVFPRFKVTFEKKQLPGLGSPSIPCMPVGSGTEG